MKVRNSRDRDQYVEGDVSWDFGTNKEITLHLPPYSVVLHNKEVASIAQYYERVGTVRQK